MVVWVVWRVRKEGTNIKCGYVGGVESQERRYCYLLCGCLRVWRVRNEGTVIYCVVV